MGKFEADAFTARLGANAEFDPKQQLRVTYSSTTTPGSTMQYDINSKAYEVLKVAPVPNYDARLYDTERLEVPARDGVKIPVTLFWRKDQKKPQMPTHLYGYGSYGTSMDPSFSASRLALVDRGICYAIAHIRGGGEMGQHLRGNQNFTARSIDATPARWRGSADSSPLDAPDTLVDPHRSPRVVREAG